MTTLITAPTLTTDIAVSHASSLLPRDRSVRAAVDEARFAMLALQLEHSPANAAERRDAAEIDAALGDCVVGADCVSCPHGTVVVHPAPDAPATTILSSVVEALNAGRRVEVHIDAVASDVARLALRRMVNALAVGRLIVDDAG